MVFLLYKIFSIILRYILYLNDLKEIYNLNVSRISYIDYFLILINLSTKFIYSILGVNMDNKNFYSNNVNLLGTNGVKLFKKETVLYDTDYLNFLVKDFINWNLSFNQVNSFINDKYVSYALNHYTSTAFFYLGNINESSYLKRRFTNFSINNNNFWMIDLFSFLKFHKLLKNNLNNTENNLNNNNFILRDTLFQSQDFKHSITFEFLWAFFPTVIIISILIPSLYLLYSLDEDLDPKLTIKVVGHHGIDPMSLIIELKFHRKNLIMLVLSTTVIL